MFMDDPHPCLRIVGMEAVIGLSIGLEKVFKGLNEKLSVADSRRHGPLQISA